MLETMFPERKILKTIQSYIARVTDGHNLTEQDAHEAFEIMMRGEATDSQIGGLLMALRCKGEALEEIVGAAKALRQAASMIESPPGTIDTCGTGGDGKGSFNISTAAAIVAAACGVKVAKHGNRAQTSQSGSADVLAALGVNLEAPLSACSRALNQAGVCFLMAPRHHQAMRHVATARRELGVRSLFNLVGPLANPAGAQRQLVGVFSSQWVTPMAEALGRLGSHHAWVVHGCDGLDEITLAGATEVAAWRDGNIHRFTVKPQDAGLATAPTQSLKGGDAVENAAIMRRILAGEPGPLRDVTILNAAAALVIAEQAEDLAAGAQQAAQAIDSGQAAATLETLIAVYSDHSSL